MGDTAKTNVYTCVGLVSTEIHINSNKNPFCSGKKEYLYLFACTDCLQDNYITKFMLLKFHEESQIFFVLPPDLSDYYFTK